MKKLFFALILLIWLSPSLAAQQDSAAAPQGAASKADASAQKPSSAAGDGVVEEIVARVNDAIITRYQLQRNQAQAEMDAQEMKLSPAAIADLKKNALRDLIDQQLLIQKAAELGISADAELIQRLDELRKQMKVDSIEALQKLAESQGVSWEEFKQNSKNGILAQKVIGSEVGGRIQITKEDVKRYYDEHKESFTQPARVRLSEILIDSNPDAVPGSFVNPTDAQVAAAQEKIVKIYNELQSGADFAEIARNQSNGTTAAQGGDLGYFKHNELAKQLEEMTFSLKAGEYTQPIQTQQGFIILLVTDRAAGGAPPLDRMRGQIQDMIYRERIQPALRTYLARLRREAYIDVRHGYIDTSSVTPETKVVYTTSSGPKTKEVSGPLGLGKKTVLVDAAEAEKEAQAKAKARRRSGSTSGIVSELDTAKAKVESAQVALEESKTPEERAKAQAAFDAAEAEMLSHMSSREKKRYSKNKKREAEKRAKRRVELQKEQKKRAERQARVEAAKAKLAAAQEALKASTSKKEANAAEKAVKKAEKEMLRQMSSRERDRYKREKREAAKQARRERDAAEEAKKQELRKEAAQQKKAEKLEAASGDASQQADAGSAAAMPTEKKKKKFSWF